MNAIVKVNFLPRTPPPDLGRRLREATFPARPRSRILRFQMLVDARRAAGCDGPRSIVFAHSADFLTFPGAKTLPTVRHQPVFA